MIFLFKHNSIIFNSSEYDTREHTCGKAPRLSAGIVDDRLFFIYPKNDSFWWFFFNYLPNPNIQFRKVFWRLNIKFLWFPLLLFLRLSHISVQPFLKNLDFGKRSFLDNIFSFQFHLSGMILGVLKLAWEKLHFWILSRHPIYF